MIDKFLSLMTPEILTNIGLFVAIALIGAIVSVMVGFLLNKYVSRKMAQGWFKKEVLESVEYYKKSSKLIISVLQIFILIFFLFLGAELLGFPSFSEFLGNLFKYIPIILGTIITLAFAIAIGKFLASKALNLNTEYSRYIAAFIEIVIIYAAILTVLEFFNIEARPFFEIFKVILYVGGTIVAISIGIPIGMSIKSSVEKTQKKNAKKKD